MNRGGCRVEHRSQRTLEQCPDCTPFVRNGRGGGIREGEGGDARVLTLRSSRSVSEYEDLIEELRRVEREKWARIGELWPSYPDRAPEGERREEADRLLGEMDRVDHERLSYSVLRDLGRMNSHPSNKELMDLVYLRRNLWESVRKDTVEVSRDGRQAYRESGVFLESHLDRLSSVPESKRPTMSEVRREL